MGEIYTDCGLWEEVYTDCGWWEEVYTDCGKHILPESWEEVLVHVIYRLWNVGGGIDDMHCGIAIPCRVISL